jgi:selenocysteine lyase/cysteine desulfurase
MNPHPPEWLDPEWLDTVRADTPGTNHVVHFNNAGSALPTTATVEAVVAHVRREAEIGGYEAAREAASRLDRVYTSLASLINTDADHIAVVENATRAWDMAIYGFPFRRGDRVLTARAEYASNAIGLLQLRRRHGIEIVLVDDDEHGQISLAHLERELGAGAVMVALTHAPTNGGLINPAEAVGALCRRFGVFYVLDACQSVGQLPIDVDAIGCDVLSATSRKYLRGPRGIGFLYVSFGGLVRTAGLVAMDYTTGAPASHTDFLVQVRATMDNLRLVLEDAGTSLDKVLETSCYVHDMGRWDEMNAIYMEYFAHPRPVRTTIETRLVPPYLFEISAVALA